MSEYVYATNGTPVSDTNGEISLPRERIVRCRDCKHGNRVTWPASFGIPGDFLDCTGELVQTWDYLNDEPGINPVRPDGFCAWGEVRVGSSKVRVGEDA